MRKKLIAIMLAGVLVLSGCASNENKEDKKTTDDSPKVEKSGLKDGTYSGAGQGFGGEIKLNLEVKDGKITDLDIVEEKETEPVFKRALPILKERILEEQSPIIDNVSAATFSSFGVKKAVGEALKEAGKDFGDITFKTEKEHGQLAEKEDLNANLVIVGGGPSGLAAAISAKESGIKDVTLVEKLDILSGNGKFDMNFFDMINSQAMNKNNNVVTKEQFLKNKEKAWDSEERKQAWVEGSWKLDEWLRTMDISLDFNYGGEGSSSHMAKEDEYAGDHIQTALEKKVQDLGVNILTGTKAVDLIIENNKVMGVKVEDRDNFYKINAGAVIVATGGFSNNKEMLKEYAPGSEIVETSNQMGTTGDFVTIFKNHNIKLDHMDQLSVFKMIIKGRRDLTGAGDGFILVNKDGKRFAPENSSGLELAHKILEQEGKQAYYIYDQNLYESFYRLKKHNDLGYHMKADTLEELADKLGINKENLVETVKKYNMAFEDGQKDEFRDKMPEKKFLEQGPYYGVPIESAIHMTKGGVVANEKAQVINNDDKVVEGLYASGEVTDTAGAYSSSVIFGRIAGEEAAKFLSE